MLTVAPIRGYFILTSLLLQGALVDGRTTIPNLFAAGDVADSVQGADRINGSGIMEALVFGAFAGAAAAEAAATRALHELRSALTTAREVVDASLRREESLGLFVTDAPVEGKGR